MNQIDNLVSKSLYRPTDGFRFSNATGGVDYNAEIKALEKKVSEYKVYIQNASEQIKIARNGIITANTVKKKAGYQNTLNTYDTAYKNYVVMVKNWEGEIKSLKDKQKADLKAEADLKEKQRLAEIEADNKLIAQGIDPTSARIKAQAEAEALVKKASNKKYYVMAGAGLLLLVGGYFLVKKLRN